MPKINVYLPEGLASAVKEVGVPVSAVCQHALELAVRRVVLVRETIAGGSSGSSSHSDRSLFSITPRTDMVMRDGERRAHAAGATALETEHLLRAILAEKDGLALRVLAALDIEPGQVERALSHAESKTATHVGAAESAAGPLQSQDEPDQAGPHPATPDRPDQSPADSALPFGPQLALALELAVNESSGLGNNYIGTEHLLLGLIAEPDGLAGQALRHHGAELRVTRRAVAAVLAGWQAGCRHRMLSGSASQVQLEDQGHSDAIGTEIARQLAPLEARITALEQNAAIPHGGRG